MIHLIKNNILSIHFSLFLNLENHSVLKISTFLIICLTFKPFTILFVLTMKFKPSQYLLKHLGIDFNNMQSSYFKQFKDNHYLMSS